MSSTTPVLRRTTWNYAFTFGFLLVASVTALALFGPTLAPHDPLKELPIIKIGATWYPAPFPPFTVPNFPLGSDRLGRDLFSRLLWAVRPTMLTISVVAALRMTLGIGLGLVAGWSTSRAARTLDSLISTAVSAPLLLVALATVAAFGEWNRIGAFIVGLTLTGWADSARLVANQARTIKGQTYVEASRALGQSELQIVRQHVVRQIAPLLWMLIALEISSTLLAAAALGFLGYYLSGDVWVPDNWANAVAQRTSGLPDLGQMLSGTFQYYTDPWGLASAGTIIFFTVLGFNLLGEGLRAQLSPDQHTLRIPLYSALAARVGPWFETHVRPTTDAYLARPRVRVALGLGLLLLCGAGFTAWRLQSTPPPPQVVLTIPGGHLWASERGDPYGTLWSAADGPTHASVLWQVTSPAAFSGGPAVDAQGALYISTHAGTLLKFDRDGKQLWEVSLPAAAVGTPALGLQGEVYAVSMDGVLSAFSADGAPLWQYAAGEAGVTGPIVAPDGIIYYVARGIVHGVAPDGTAHARATRTITLQDPLPPRLSPDGHYVFLKDSVALDLTGSTFTPLRQIDNYTIGGDGRMYVRYQNILREWQVSEQVATVTRETTWDYRSYTIGIPRDGGVTRDGVVWFIYFSPIEDARLVWFTFNRQQLGTVRYSQRNSVRLIGLDRDATTYVCGTDYVKRPPILTCVAYQPGLNTALWRVELGPGARVSGGALVPGRIYVALEQDPGGTLTALADAP